MNILETIIEKKKQEVAEKKLVADIDFLKSLNHNFNRKGLSLKTKTFKRAA